VTPTQANDLLSLAVSDLAAKQYNVKPIAPSTSCELQRSHGPNTGADYLVRQDSAGQDLDLDVLGRLCPRSNRSDSNQTEYGGKTALG
jgi:hypothetical protein